MPGLHTHPFRSPEGHLYTDGSAPIEAVWATDLPWAQDEAWLWGCELYQQRYHWEAHEAWEALWHQVPQGSVDHLVLQGLIQASACVLKHHLGHILGAARLRDRASARLEEAARQAGPVVRGVHLLASLEQLDAFLEADGSWPLLVMERPPPGEHEG